MRRGVWLPAGLIVLGLAWPAAAQVVTTCDVQVFEAGTWSSVTGSRVTFMTGAELGKAGGAYKFDPFKPYAVIQSDAASPAVIALDDARPVSGTMFTSRHLRDLFATRRVVEGLQVNGQRMVVKWRIGLRLPGI